MDEHPARPGAAHPHGQIEQLRSGTAMRPWGPSHPPTWSREVKKAPAVGSRAPPGWDPGRGSRGSLLPVPGRGDPRDQRRAGLGCRARAIGGKRKKKKKRKKTQRGWILDSSDSSGWVPGDRTDGPDAAAPPGPAHAARALPRGSPEGTAAPRGRAGAAGPCPFPESPAGHRHGGTQTQGWKNPLRLCPCLAPAPCLPPSRPHSRPAALHTAVPKAPACPWRCAPAAAAALLRTPRSVPAQEGALGRLSRGFPAGPGWGQLPAGPPEPRAARPACGQALPQPGTPGPESRPQAGAGAGVGRGPREVERSACAAPRQELQVSLLLSQQLRELVWFWIFFI